MSGAATIGQGAIVVAAPVLARLYDPQAFGLPSVYAAVLSVLVAIASLRFDFAIPIATDPVEVAHLLNPECGHLPRDEHRVGTRPILWLRS